MLVDVGLVHHGVQYVQDLQDIPNARIGLQNFDLVLTLLGQLGTKLLERLELVDELVNDLPKPLIGQIQGYGGVGAQDVIEQVAVVVVGLQPLVDGGSACNACVNVPIVQLFVENQKELIFLHVLRHDIGLWPRGGLKELLREFGEATFVAGGDFEGVALIDHVPEIGQELLHRLWDVLVESAGLLTFVLTVEHGVTSVAIAIILVVLQLRKTFYILLFSFSILHIVNSHHRNPVRT